MSGHPIDISKLLEVLTKAAEAKTAFVPANDPMMASLGAGNPPMPAGGPPGGAPPPPMPGGPMPPGGPPPMGGGLDLSALLGGPVGPPMGPDMGAPPPGGPPPAGGPPGTAPPPPGSEPGAQQESPETDEARGSVKAVDMTRDEFQSLIRSSMDQVISKQMSDVLRSIDTLSKRIDTLVDQLRNITERDELLGGRELR